MIGCILMMVDTAEERRKVERLYKQYNRLMYAIAYNILHHHEDAEDAVLASWEKIICHLDKINEKEKAKTKSFLILVVEHTAIDLCRKNKRKEICLEELESSPYAATKDMKLNEVEVTQWIHSLPKKYAEALLMYYVNQLSQQEIADILDITVNSVAIRIHRGRKMLKEGDL